MDLFEELLRLLAEGLTIGAIIIFLGRMILNIELWKTGKKKAETDFKELRLKLGDRFRNIIEV